jgi:hypothetical protein
MSFQYERSPSRQWASLQAEHDLLENAIKQHQCSGWHEYLDARVADSERGIVLYYVEGLGMGDGQRFVLVFERQLIGIDVMKVWGGTDHLSTPLRIGSVDIPEALNDRRETLKVAFAQALQANDQACPFAWSPTQLLLNYQDTQWQVIPKKYSWLYWKTVSANTWSWHKTKLRQAVAYATSPLVVASLLALLSYLSIEGASVPIWSLFIAGAWLIHCIDRYDNDYRPLYWLIGLAKSKSQFPMLALSKITARLMNPQPLNLLTAQLRLKPDRVDTCTFVIANRSWFLVSYVGVGALDIADAVAPGYSASLRAEKKGAIDSKKLEAVFPKVSRKWLLPKQSVQWQIPLLQEFPLHAPPSHITAIVSISKHASGEPKHGPTSFQLPLTVV